MFKKLFHFAAVMLCAVLFAGVLTACGGSHDTTTYRAKADLLKTAVLTETTAWEVGIDPAGDIGFVVFMSVCDTLERADVFCGSGDTLEAAWQAADEAAEAALKKSGREPVWVKADLVYISAEVAYSDLSTALAKSQPGFVHYGVSFDSGFKNALLEAELNGVDIYRYGDVAGIDLESLNAYLSETGRKKLKSLPDSCTVFQCFGWLCDEESEVHMLSSSSQNCGRRTVDLIDAAYAEELIATASDYLAGQIKEDGSFVYGYYPRFDNEIDNYNILRHAGTVWSLICRYRMTGDAELAETIDLAIEYMLSQLVYPDENTAYLYEAKADEIKLGGCGIAVVALTEYMDAFGTDKYLDVCRKMGNGILSLMDQENGTYYHVLNGDFSEKEEFRTVYYDGEATFALCRLYSVTGDQVWLDAAKSAVNHFIAADYVQYRDQWVAYSMNEITKYVDDPAYYAFALRNVQENYEQINRETTAPVCFELLMSTFELYDRLLERGASIGGFDDEEFLRTIYSRADRMLDGYFYPEYAMYMENPSRILGAFMVREDGYRTRIDDVQHCIGGYYLYYKNYAKLVGYGMLSYRD